MSIRTDVVRYVEQRGAVSLGTLHSAMRQLHGYTFAQTDRAVWKARRAGSLAPRDHLHATDAEGEPEPMSQRRILRAVRGDDGWTVARLAVRLRMAETTVARNVAELRRGGWLLAANMVALGDVEHVPRNRVHDAGQRIRRAALQAHDGFTAASLARACGCDPGTAASVCAAMLRDGVLVATGSGNRRRLSVALREAA